MAIGSWGLELKVSKLCSHGWFHWQPVHILRLAFKKITLLTYANMWLYGACYTNNGRHPFHLYYFEVISGTKDEGPNLTTKGVSTALI